ncbi:MAG: phage terminase large subunit family protein [Magnetococcales bacterium]|nr:phage terminase large subunit family protein [Magnetococcales bacterium]
MASGAFVVRKAAAAALRPPPDITVSEWADKHRILKVAGEPGRWRTSRTPYLKEIMDCLSDGSLFERVVFVKPSQVGATEILLNWIGYSIHYSPGPMAVVTATMDLAKTLSQTRLDPMIADNQILKDLVVEQKSRDSGNSTNLKVARNGAVVWLKGANSPASLMSIAVKRLAGDEVERWPGNVGGEGDPVWLAEARTNTFRGQRKIYLTSSPKIKGSSRIERAYLDSDQRKFFVPCPFCKQLQTLVWKQVKFPENDRSKAFYECEHCRAVIQEYHKAAMMAEGVWIAAKPGGKTAGFWLSGLYSPWVSWGDLAVQELAAEGSQELKQVWTNSSLGELWDDSGEGVDPTGLLERREVWGPFLPPQVAVLVAGLDVQPDRIEMEVVGFGAGEESWSIAYKVLWGDSSGKEVWEALDQELLRSWQHSRKGVVLHIQACVIDSAGHNTTQVYDFVRPRQSRRIWAGKGYSVPGKPLWPGKPSRNTKNKTPIYMLGVDAAKNDIAFRLKMTASGPGYMHFPMDRDKEYFDQLTAEKAVTEWHRGSPVRVWVKEKHARNEALDCRVYAMAALAGLKHLGLKLNQVADKMTEIDLREDVPKEEPRAPAVTPQPTPQPAPKPPPANTAPRRIIRRIT